MKAVPPFGYEVLFSRNLGIVSKDEQLILKKSRVGIAGVGGVGGAHAITLARMGIGHFHLADPDFFEAANMNRQFGATFQSLGQSKTIVLKEMIQSINPDAEVTIFDDGINSQNCKIFLQDTDLVLDGIDAFAVSDRRILYESCLAQNIFVIASGPVGLTATLHVFGPGSMSFEDYFDFRSCQSEEEMFVAFIVGTCPSFLHWGQIDSNYIDIGNQRGPSLAPSINLCAALACSEALQILLHRNSSMLAPRYLQFDLKDKTLAKKYLFWGNRNPLQRLKRRFALHVLQKK
jgi:molybdopterin/thiamine biosynthesis adenylyltransferase